MYVTWNRVYYERQKPNKQSNLYPKFGKFKLFNLKCVCKVWSANESCGVKSLTKLVLSETNFEDL